MGVMAIPNHYGTHTPVAAFRPSEAERPKKETKKDKWRLCAGAHLFPFRTEKLSPAATMILRETVGK